MKVARFVSDSRGFRFSEADVPRDGGSWVTAEIGTTREYVRINLSLAYAIENDYVTEEPYD